MDMKMKYDNKAVIFQGHFLNKESSEFNTKL